MLPWHAVQQQEFFSPGKAIADSQGKGERSLWPLPPPAYPTKPPVPTVFLSHKPAPLWEYKPILNFCLSALRTLNTASLGCIDSYWRAPVYKLIRGTPYQFPRYRKQDPFSAQATKHG